MKMTLKAVLSCWGDSAELCCFGFLGPGITPDTGELYTRKRTHMGTITLTNVFYGDHSVHVCMYSIKACVCVHVCMSH